MKTLKRITLTPVIWSCVLSICTSSSANGNTQSQFSEKKLLTAWSLTKDVAYSCLSLQSECGLDGNETQILKDLAKFLDNRYSEETIKIVSEKERPDLFNVLSGPHRFAVTGSSPGSSIYVNKDILRANPDVKIEELISLLFHELGHHTGLPDSEDRTLEKFGSKMGKMFSRHAQESDPLEGELSHIHVLIYNHISSESKLAELGQPKLGTDSRVFVLDGLNVLELDRIHYLLNCFYGATVNQLWLTGLHWSKSHQLSSSQKFRLVAQAEEAHYCRGGSSPEEYLRVAGRSYVLVDLIRDKEGIFRMDGWPSVQVVQINPDHVDTDRSFENLLSNDKPAATLSIEEIKTNAIELSEGQSWSVQATLNVNGNFEAKSCTLLISSDDFLSRYSNGDNYVIEAYLIVPTPAKISKKFDACNVRRQVELKFVERLGQSRDP